MPPPKLHQITQTEQPKTKHTEIISASVSGLTVTWYYMLAVAPSTSNAQPAIRLVLLDCSCKTGEYQFSTFRPVQNGRHFPDDVFKRVSWLNSEYVWISRKISLKFVPKVPIYNISYLVLIMIWHRSGDMPLSEPIMVSELTHICITRPQWVRRGY